MLRNLKLKNFKAWRTLELEFGKVTGLFGVNSSGKSSVLQFLLLLKQTKNATDRGLVLDFGGPDQLVNLGAYEMIVHRRRKRDDIEWELDWELSKSLVLRVPTDRNDVSYEGKHLQLNACVGLNASRLSARHLKYKFSNTDFGIGPKAGKLGVFDLESTEGNPRFTFVRNRGRPGDLPGPVKTHRFPDQAHTYFQNTDFLSEFEAQYESLMDSIFYLGPLREYPKRQYPWSGASPDGVGSRGERTVDAILAATAVGEKFKRPDQVRRTQTFQKVIAYWLERLGLIKEFRVMEIRDGTNLYHALVKTEQDSPETMLTDVGFGVSQVLPILVLLYYVPERSVVLMEQPEIHLHPSVQTGLADLMLEVAQTRQVQIVVESHSEHLLRRFQRRVAEDTIPSSDLRLYFVHTDHSEAELRDLQLNEWGEIKNWPNKFFGDEMGEIAAISRAALRRRIEAAK